MLFSHQLYDNFQPYSNIYRKTAVIIKCNFLVNIWHRDLIIQHSKKFMTNRSGCIPGKITYWVMLQFSQSSVHLISSGIFFIRKRENKITELVWISLKNKFQAQWRGFSLIYSLLFFSLLPSGIVLQKQQRAEEKTIRVLMVLSLAGPCAPSAQLIPQSCQSEALFLGLFQSQSSSLSPTTNSSVNPSNNLS